MHHRLLLASIGVAMFVPLGVALAAPPNTHPAASAPAAGVPRTTKASRRLHAGLDRIADAASAKSPATLDAYRKAHPHARFVDGQAGALVLADVVARRNPQALAARLDQLGARRIAMDGNVVSALVPVAALRRLEADPDLAFARPVKARTRRGTVVSQGDHVLRAPLARPPATAGGPTGAGVKVGVLSDSFDCKGGAFNDIANDEYNPVEVIDENCALGDSDEGRAMVQIVADVAPDASLLFHTAFGGQAAFAQGIRRLANRGATVIVDDVGYSESPYFHDGRIAQAVDDVFARGVAYLSSAANSGRMSYESAFRSAPTEPLFEGGAGVAHDFVPGPAVNLYQGIYIASGQTIDLGFQWDDPFWTTDQASGGAKGDLDIYLFDPAVEQIVAAGEDFNIENDPLEFLTFTNPGPGATFYIRIEFFGGVLPTRIKYIDYGDGDELLVDYASDSGTIVAHPNAKGAFAVGAAAYELTPECGVTPAQLEPYSSAGGTPILLLPNGKRIAADNRKKPDATGPDGANTSFFGFDIPNPGGVAACRDRDTRPNFFGTSAAAPHVAGVAALMRERKPTATPSQIYAALRSTASGMGDAGFDFDSGYGFVRADAAVKKIANARPTVSLSRAQQGVDEGAAGQVSLKLNAKSASTVTVTLALSGSASPGADVTVPPLTVEIPPNTLSKAIALPTVEDGAPEADETLIVTITAATKADVGLENRYKLTIRDDD